MKKKTNDLTKMFFKHDFFEGENWESAWVKHEKGNYKLDNILFYSKGYSCGDIIKGVEKDGMLCADKLILPSGNSTVQIIFFDEELVKETRVELKEMGCESELSNMNTLISVDIPFNIVYRKILSFLENGEREGKWEYQEACISSVHKNQNV